MDGDIPIDQVRYELTDFVVSSLRASPEHKSLTSNWSAMLRVLETDTSMSDDDSSPNMNQRVDAVKKRVLLRFLVSAGKMEVSGLDKGVNENLDPDLVEARKASQESMSRSRKKQKVSSTHEEFTLALLGTLPALLTSYKTETGVLQSLTSLPQYFCKYLCAVFFLFERSPDGFLSTI